MTLKLRLDCRYKLPVCKLQLQQLLHLHAQLTLQASHVNARWLHPQYQLSILLDGQPFTCVYPALYDISMSITAYRVAFTCQE